MIAGPYSVPAQGGNGRAIALALVMHALLGALLFFGIRWQSSVPAVVEAELWSATPQTAAPPPRSLPPPQKVESPPPVPRVAPEPPPPKADILEKVPVKTAPKPEPRVEPPKVIPPKATPQPPVQKVEPPKQPPPKPAKETAPRAPSDLAALLASAEGPGPVTSTGRDKQTSGPRGRDGYIAKLVTAIRSQMRYPGSSPGNPFATVRIEQLPTGEVTAVTLTKSSGVSAFDDAVERAVRAASPLPRDTDGRVERTLNLNYYMYEQ